ncbi:hypothetical protein M011DRAFT_460310 [Sporormia fimetaria CBS 119925]|uniref:Uncharacterized protein n=1 Tax=Sporormia fimetaria CBS 119925 TaxID=1340428 RepID=A0A6A6V6H5_9PLEO|nr:hypothetical protein M011DRAFT_460310 [Sporormia fimetaria CBS 119925]
MPFCSPQAWDSKAGRGSDSKGGKPTSASMLVWYCMHHGGMRSRVSKHDTREILHDTRRLRCDTVATPADETVDSPEGMTSASLYLVSRRALITQARGSRAAGVPSSERVGLSGLGIATRHGSPSQKHSGDDSRQRVSQTGCGSLANKHDDDAHALTQQAFATECAVIHAERGAAEGCNNVERWAQQARWWRLVLHHLDASSLLGRSGLPPPSFRQPRTRPQIPRCTVAYMQATGNDGTINCPRGRSATELKIDPICSNLCRLGGACVSARRQAVWCGACQRRGNATLMTLGGWAGQWLREATGSGEECEARGCESANTTAWWESQRRTAKHGGHPASVALVESWMGMAGQRGDARAQQ